jgi:nucleoside phosphorylase
MSSKTTTNVCEDYTIAWIAALPHERAAGIAMLDERHQQPQDFSKNASDPNSYTWGQIGKHSVVIASLPAGEYGLTTTAVTVQGLRSSLPHLRFGLLVGIGAGVPGEKQLADGSVTVLRDIRLGDVVVSNPEGTNGGVVQYDFVKAKQSFERKGFLNSPPQVLRNALSALQAEHLLDDTRISEFVAESSKRYPKTAKTYARPEPDTDRLFKASYDHDGNAETCRDCLASEFVIRSSREHVDIHYGTIASGNTLVKNAAHRDEIVTWLRKENLDPLCFEMEAAGLMNAFPCMVVRGICDYGDSHKNDSWQNHAAIAAAAFGKELLSFVDAEEAKKGPELRDLLRDSQSPLYFETRSCSSC